jgi:hypothetical protein
MTAVMRLAEAQREIEVGYDFAGQLRVGVAGENHHGSGGHDLNPQFT